MATERVSGIYKIQNKVNGKCYVGSAINIKNRWREHKRGLTLGDHRNDKLKKAWAKYGSDCFCFAVLEIVDQKTELIAAEQRWIDRLNCVSDGYNIAPIAGSQLGYRHTDKSKEAMSITRRGRKCSPEVAAAISKALKGVPKTKEHAAKVGASRRGWNPSIETRLKMSLSSKTRVRKPFSAETIARMSAAAKARKMMKHTPEQRAARSKWMRERHAAKREFLRQMNA